MSALAIFSCRPNSHPFQERHMPLHEAIKIGRSVARARPAPNNGVFDCKVLSRNHAMTWYENGKFFLQDTKSSNGTFVNNQRLSKGSEESPAREIFSGDLIQFGVDVMENNRRGEKITHGCIIAQVTLFHPDGREAKPLPNQPCPLGTTVQSQDLYQLSQYLQEALHREQMLEQKLASLQKLIQNTQEASESGWQALIDEDRLLSRLEVLESQLHSYSKNHTEDTLRQELVALQDDKHKYETTAKESLRRVLQEKLDAVRKLTDLERSLSNTEDECSHLKEMCEASQQELQTLAEKYEDQLKEVQELQEKLQEAERKHEEEVERFEQEKHELQDKLEEMIKEEALLSAKVESIQADNDFTKEQLTAVKAKMEDLKEKSVNNKFELDIDDIIPLKNQESSELEEKLQDTQKLIEEYKTKLEISEKKIKLSAENVELLQKQLESAQLDSRQYVARIASLEEKLKLSDLQLNQMMETTMADLNLQLNESKRQKDSSFDVVKDLEEQVAEQEELYMNTLVVNNVPSGSHDNNSFNGLHNHVDSTNVPNPYRADIENLNALLSETRETHRKTEQELVKCKGELDEARTKLRKSLDDTNGYKTQLIDSQKVAKDRSETVVDLQDQLKKAESTTKEVKQQILDLRGQLQEAQQTAKQSKNEAEQLRNKVKVLQEDLDREKSRETTHHGKQHSHPETSHKQPISSKNKAEFAALKEECANLKKRIQAIEAEMKMSRKENLQLSSDYNKLQESYKELEALKETLESREVTWMLNLTDSQKDAEQSKQEVRPRGIPPLSADSFGRQLTLARQEIGTLRGKVTEYKEEITQLHGEICNLSEDYQVLADRSKMLSLCSSIPLLVLMFGILLALYPVLAEITATTL